MSSYRIVSFDGGPSALTTLLCLIEIERKTPGFIAATDLFAGASAGAWTALYLARNMSLVDAGTISGEALLQACLDFLKASLAAMRPLDPQSAWVDFMVGKAPLLDYTNVQTLMDEPANYGQGTLGQLARRAVVISGRARSPWSPRVYDSGSSEDDAEALTNAALCSGSFPMVYAIRDGQVDGAMYTNNPAMVSLVQAMAGTDRIAPIAPAATRLFTLGSDDGSSNLSNLFLPGSHVADTALEGAGAPPATPEILSVFAKLNVVEAQLSDAAARIEAIVSALLAHHPPVIDAQTAAGMRQITPHLHDRIGRTRLELASPVKTSTSLDAASAPVVDDPWGWPPWTVAPLNFLYLLQVMLNSQGRGVGDQCRRLLGERSLRLGPVTLLPTNVAAMLLLLGLDEIVIAFGDITAALWRITWPASIVRWIGFQPDFATTLAWVAADSQEGTNPSSREGSSPETPLEAGRQ